MTKDESKRKTLEQWADTCPIQSVPSIKDKLKFYAWLMDAYPELLQWKNGTELERWQEIQAW
jgi:hypothetical protein